MIHRGVNSLNSVRGMFSFCFYDSLLEKFIFARDSLGIKPLFYSFSDNTFAFSSTQSSLRCFLESFRTGSVSLCPSSLCKYLYAGYIPAPSTAYSGISQLQPGHYIELHNSSSVPDLFLRNKKWAFPVHKYRHTHSIKKSSFSLSALHASLKSVVKDHLVGDVEPGLMLSGGIDSSLLAYYSNLCGYKPHCFTINSINDPNSSELLYAKYVAKKLDLPLTVVDIDFSSFSIEESIDRVLSLTGTPFANSTILLQDLLCKYIKDSGFKYALSGDGADEVFSGYPRYQALYIQNHALFSKSTFLPLFASLISFLPESPHFNHLVRRLRLFFEASHNAPSYLYELPLHYFKTDDLSHPVSPFLSDYYDLLPSSCSYVEKAMFSDMNYFLPFNLLSAADCASGHNSIELRVPFLDQRLIAHLDSSADVSFFASKKRLKRLSAEFFGRTFAYRKKRGFNPPIWSLILCNRDYVYETLFSSRSLNLLCPSYDLRGLLDDHYNRRKDSSKQIWSLLVLSRFLTLSSLELLISSLFLPV